MTDKNTMGLSRYIFYNLLTLAIEESICFKLFLPLLSFKFGKGFLFTSIIFSVALTIGGVMITYDKRRNHFSVFINTVTPSVLLILVMCSGRYTGFHKAFAVCAFTLSLCYTYLVYKHRPKARDRFSRKKIIDSCRRRSLLGARTITTLFLIILTGVTAIQRVNAVSDMNAVDNEIVIDFSDYTIEKNKTL